jgi:ligand-binding sensor domain-containing protein
MIREITEDSEGNIWFSSSRNKEGGLVKFDGSRFTLLSPDNSLLPLNGVAAVTADNNNGIWIAQFGYLNDDQVIAKIYGEEITLFGSEDIGFFPVQWSDIEADSRNRIWIGHDYSFTSATYNPRPQLLIIDRYKISTLSFDDTSNIKKMAVDHDDNLWCLTNDMLVVYNGCDWIVDSLTFRDGWVNDIDVSKDNRIWVAASTGIFISK